MTAPGAHLIGSVPLADAEAVFRTVCGALWSSLLRVPDGETGERRRWIWFQRQMLERHPAIEIDPTVPPFVLKQWDGKILRETPLLRAVLPVFGVSTECGWGRTDPQRVASVLESHRRALKTLVP